MAILDEESCLDFKMEINLFLEILPFMLILNFGLILFDFHLKQMLIVKNSYSFMAKCNPLVAGGNNYIVEIQQLEEDIAYKS